MTSISTNLPNHLAAPSTITLADALEAYELAVACGTPSLVQAERFADLRGAHNARMVELVDHEDAVERVWGRLETTLGGTR